MEKFNISVYNYIQVEGESLKDINENTRKIWNDAIVNGYNDIIDITKETDKVKKYLIDTSVYYNLIQASKEGGIDPYGIPNVNFTLIDRTDNRWKEFYEQRMERGFDDSETWSLDSTITKFILPRLKCFRENHNGFPSCLTSKQWDEILDKMILAFEYLDNEDLGVDTNNKSFKECHEERNKIINEGLKLFTEYYCDLWW